MPAYCTVGVEAANDTQIVLGNHRVQKDHSQKNLSKTILCIAIV